MYRISWERAMRFAGSHAGHNRGFTIADAKPYELTHTIADAKPYRLTHAIAVADTCRLTNTCPDGPFRYLVSLKSGNHLCRWAFLNIESAEQGG
jgi:hypothetical protein